MIFLIRLSCLNDEEYIIKDSNGINIGRIDIFDLVKKRYCNLRIKYYKNMTEGYKIIENTLNLLCNSIFNKMELNKLNVFIEQDVNIAAFSHIGFKLEGILSESVYQGDGVKAELIFGIDYNTYVYKHKDKDLQIEGKNLTLRILTKEHAEKMMEYYKDNIEHLKLFEPDREDKFYTLNYQVEALITSYKQFLEGTYFGFGIFLRDKLIGRINLTNIVYGSFKSGFIGYSIHKDYTRKGYMTEAVKLLSKYAGDKLKLHRIEASVLTTNLSSQRVLEKCNFTKVGLCPKYLYLNGDWRDHYIYQKILQD
ncbi:MAG: GNAT family N-acetyltransferase [Oscillospiraceae bacterium]|nr:GNAT family N-acetyltransferase [Oscillospiraceae bacterium]